MTIQRDAVLEWLRAVAVSMSTNKEYLTKLDSDIGDGDHGINMDRGFQAVLGKLGSLGDKDIGAIFKTVGMTLVATVGGASGPLYGTLFLQMGGAANGKLELTTSDWAAALQAGVDGIAIRGKAAAGDKTMLDALLPAIAALKVEAKAGSDLATCLKKCAEAAAAGAAATIPLVAHKGRASYLGERSAGHQDPGATSSTLMLQAARASWA